MLSMFSFESEVFLRTSSTFETKNLYNLRVARTTKSSDFDTLVHLVVELSQSDHVSLIISQIFLRYENIPCRRAPFSMNFSKVSLSSCWV